MAAALQFRAIRPISTLATSAPDASPGIPTGSKAAAGASSTPSPSCIAGLLRHSETGSPYVPVIVELEEGPRMPSNLVECEPDPANIKVGMAVEVVFQALDDNVTIPYFRPAS